MNKIYSRTLCLVLLFASCALPRATAVVIQGKLDFQGTATLNGAGLGDATILTEWLSVTVTGATGIFAGDVGKSVDFTDPWAFHIDQQGGSSALSLFTIDGYTFSFRQARGTALNGGTSFLAFGGVGGNGDQGRSVRATFSFLPTQTAGLFSFTGQVGVPDGGNTGLLLLSVLGLGIAIQHRSRKS